MGTEEASRAVSPVPRLCWEPRWGRGCPSCAELTPCRTDPELCLLWENWGKVALGTLLNICLFRLSSPDGSRSEVIWNPPLRFFEDLEKRHQENILIPDISDIVEEHASNHFSPYVSYCSNEVYQQRTLQKLL